MIKCLFFYKMEMVSALHASESFCGEVYGLDFGGHVTAFGRLNPYMIADFDARRVAALCIADYHVFIAAFDKTQNSPSFQMALTNAYSYPTLCILRRYLSYYCSISKSTYSGNIAAKRSFDPTGMKIDFKFAQL